MGYFYLALAIVAEMIGTSCLSISNGFTRLLPNIGVVIGYAISFYFLSLALRDIPTGVAYAIWSGVGIVLISAIAWVFLGQRLDWPGVLGISLIVAGVLVLNLWSKAGGH
jgi:small multidrug resistance pump